MSTPMGFEQAAAAASRFLQEPVTVYDETLVRDDSGGSTTVHIKRLTPGLRGWVAAPSARRAAGGMADREAADVALQVENTSVVVLTLPHDFAIKEGDWVDTVNVLWRVQAELTLDSERAVSTRVMLRELDDSNRAQLQEA
jgi:hypothetical protein